MCLKVKSFNFRFKGAYYPFCLSDINKYSFQNKKGKKVNSQFEYSSNKKPF